MLVLPTEFTQKQASACLRMLVQGLKAEAGPTLVVDATALDRFDSSALAVLLELRRESLAVILCRVRNRRLTQNHRVLVKCDRTGR